MSTRKLGIRRELGYIKEIIEDKCVICHLTENVYHEIENDLNKFYIYLDEEQTFKRKKTQLVEIKSKKLLETKNEGGGEEFYAAYSINPYFIGFVKIYDSERGFGIIQSNYDEFFIHHSNIKNSKEFEENRLVVFETTHSKEKFQAIKCGFLTNKRLKQDFFLFEQIEKLILDNRINLKEIIDSNKILLGEYTVELLNKCISPTDKDLIFQFWMKGYYREQNEQILLDFLKDDELFEKYIDNNKDFNKKYPRSENFKNDIFKIFYNNFENFNNDSDIGFIKNIISTLKKYFPSLIQPVEEYIIEHSTDYVILKLLLEEIIINIEPNRYKFLFPVLNFKDQKLLFKRLFRELSKQENNITIDEILSLPAIDYNLSEDIRKLDNRGLDYSISIIINILNQWINSDDKSKTIRNIEKSIFSIVESFINQVSEPEHLLEITGFFNECEGICKIAYIENKNEQGEVEISDIVYNRQEIIKSPPFYCDGRKLFDKKTNEPIVDKKTKLEMWWCANSFCYKPSRELHESENWKDYTILDFLNILNIHFEMEEYELLLSLINKTNQFFTHLKCESCGHILHPLKQTNYAFWRINKFHCTNSKCDNNDEIYLSHCLNGSCDNIIDSRVSAKCNYTNQNPPQFVSEGLYICNKCSACCNTETLKRILEKPFHSGDFKQNLLWRIENNAAHKERKERFCYKCGIMMIDSRDEYKRILDWFIKNRKKNKNILNSGQRERDKKYWFRLEANPAKFQTLEKLGFIVKRDEDFRNMAFISERFNNSLENIWHCPNQTCNIYFDGQQFSDYNKTSDSTIGEQCNDLESDY